MALLQSDPFAMMRRLHEDMNRSRQLMTASGFPPVNIWQGTDSLAITAELPGVEPGDIDLQVKADALTIAGERKSPPPEGDTRRRRERAFGRFGRLVRLPYRVDPDKVEARFEHGVLEIELHRPEADKPRRIEIKAG